VSRVESIVCAQAAVCGLRLAPARGLAYANCLDHLLNHFCDLLASLNKRGQQWKAVANHETRRFCTRASFRPFDEVFRVHVRRSSPNLTCQ